MHRNKSIDVHRFTMIPRADIPRSTFQQQATHKTTFDSGYLVPIYVDEVLPGDTFNLKMTAFARLSTPLYPIMDNMTMDTFFFFIPNRLVWDNWQKFMGEQENPGDSIEYHIPTMNSPTGGYAVNSLEDYMGLPTVGQVDPAQHITHNVLPLRCYNLIYNEWFRDENLQNSRTVHKGNTGDTTLDYTLLRRGKRKDYFTSALPWPQKGQAVMLPLGSNAPVHGNGKAFGITNGVDNYGLAFDGTGKAIADKAYYNQPVGSWPSVTGGAGTGKVFGPSTGETGLYADLSQATSATINAIRQAFQIQKLLERDARGGTRYTEIIFSHFGVRSPDARLQRPEYIGGGSTPIAINPIAQTSATGAASTTTPLGTLASMGTALAHNHGFTQSFTEHGYIIGLVQIRAELTYQQGLNRMWSRQTRYDFYFPVFAMLGEQAILNKEIYATGNTTQDNSIFGYQERWAEYRYYPSRISGLFRSTSAGTLDAWHLAQKFENLPTLNTSFIQDNPPVDRIVAVGDAANGKQFIFDSFFDIKKARPMPMYSVPGLIDHF